MSKIRNMSAGRAGSSLYNSNINGNQGGGNKKGGLATTTNKRVQYVIPAIRSRAYSSPDQRKMIYCVNQLGGIGAPSKMFATTADGSCASCSKEAKAHNFVVLAYRQLLGRGVDEGGLRKYTKQILNDPRGLCVGMKQVESDLMNSPEGRKCISKLGTEETQKRVDIVNEYIKKACTVVPTLSTKPEPKPDNKPDNKFVFKFKVGPDTVDASNSIMYIQYTVDDEILYNYNSSENFDGGWIAKIPDIAFPTSPFPADNSSSCILPACSNWKTFKNSVTEEILLPGQAVSTIATEAVDISDFKPGDEFSFTTYTQHGVMPTYIRIINNSNDRSIFTSSSLSINDADPIDLKNIEVDPSPSQRDNQVNGLGWSVNSDVKKSVVDDMPVRVYKLADCKGYKMSDFVGSWSYKYTDLYDGGDADEDFLGGRHTGELVVNNDGSITITGGPLKHDRNRGRDGETGREKDNLEINILCDNVIIRKKNSTGSIIVESGVDVNNNNSITSTWYDVNQILIRRRDDGGWLWVRQGGREDQGMLCNWTKK